MVKKGLAHQESRTPIGRVIHNTWNNINIRCGKYKHLRTEKKCRTYNKIGVDISRDILKQYCLTNEEHILSLTRPSIDRIDKNKGYSIDNIRFIELEDNIRKDKVKAVDGRCECYVCKETKALEVFVRDKNRKNGYRTVCLECERNRNTRRKNEIKKMRGSSGTD